VSKRSFRRLAVVAGAALAVGSMAPAMAAQVVSTNSAGAGVAVDTIDVSQILGGAQSNQLPTSLVLGNVNAVETLAGGTAFAAVADVQKIGYDALGGVQCVAGVGTSSVLGLGAVATGGATVGVGLGGVGLGLGGAAGLVAAPLTLVGNATTCLNSLKGDVLTTANHVQGAAMMAAGLATSTALQAPGMAANLQPTVIHALSPLLLNNLATVGVSGGASSNTVAGLAGLVNFL